VGRGEPHRIAAPWALEVRHRIGVVRRHDDRTAILSVGAVLAIAFLACATQKCEGTPPSGAGGQSCIMQCQRSSDRCRAIENDNVQQCEWRKQQAQAALDRCRATTDDAMSCNQEGPLCYMANYNPCDIRYRDCYRACGGTVTEAP
jgi:hypothetical protein